MKKKASDIDRDGARGVFRVQGSGLGLGLGALKKLAGDIDKDPRGVFAQLVSYLVQGLGLGLGPRGVFTPLVSLVCVCVCLVFPWLVSLVVSLVCVCVQCLLGWLGQLVTLVQFSVFSVSLVGQFSFQGW